MNDLAIIKKTAHVHSWWTKMEKQLERLRKVRTTV
jgi:hypothetical protein